MRPLRVCHVKRGDDGRSVDWGGAETSVRDLAVATDARGHHVHVVGPTAFLRAADFPQSIATTASAVRFGDAVALARIFRRERFDVIVFHVLRSTLVGGLAAGVVRGPATVSNLHNSLQQEFFTNPRTAGGLDAAVKNRLRRSAFRATLRRPHSVTVAISPSVRRDLIEHDGIRPDQVRLIDNWVAGRFAPLSDDARRAVRHGLGIEDQHRLVLFVGRLEQQKRPDLVVAALAHLPEDFRLVIVGDGPMERQIRDSTTRFGERVRMLGRLPDPAAAMSAADVVVMPSRYEGFGRVAIESLATGTPLVHSGVAGLSDAVGRLHLDAADHRAVDGDDPASWAAAVEAVAGPRRNDAARRRHEAVAARYGMERAVDAYIELYRDVTTRRLAARGTAPTAVESDRGADAHVPGRALDDR